MTEENFKMLFEVFTKLAAKKKYITSNQNDIKLIIDTLIEYLISVKDNKDTKYFDIFMQLNMIKEIIGLTSENNRIINIAVFKGFALLLSNLSNHDQLLYLFSNNYINRLLCLPYDNTDTDFVYYYINFIKSLVMKIDNKTVNYFFNNKFYLYNMLKLYYN